MLLSVPRLYSEDPIKSRRYDFVYEEEARKARIEFKNQVTLAANHELDPVINKAIMVWQKDSDKEKFNKATEAALKNYRNECDKLQKCFEKRMAWAEKNLHASSQEEAMKAVMKIANRSVQNFMRKLKIW